MNILIGYIKYKVSCWDKKIIRKKAVWIPMGNTVGDGVNRCLQVRPLKTPHKKRDPKASLTVYGVEENTYETFSSTV